MNTADKKKDKESFGHRFPRRWKIKLLYCSVAIYTFLFSYDVYIYVSFNIGSAKIPVCLNND